MAWRGGWVVRCGNHQGWRRDRCDLVAVVCVAQGFAAGYVAFVVGVGQGFLDALDGLWLAVSEADGEPALHCGGCYGFRTVPADCFDSVVPGISGADLCSRTAEHEFVQTRRFVQGEPQA